MGGQMDAIMPVLLAAGVLASAGVAWFVAHRRGAPAGLVLPVVIGAAALWRGAMPIGHAEAAMGRGIEMFLLWTPLLALTVIAAGLGFLSRRRLGPVPRG